MTGEGALGAGRRLADVLACLAVGALGAFAVVAMAGLELKYLAVFVAALLGGVPLLLVLDAERRMHLALVGLALSIPFYIDKNIGYQAHVGGASNLAVSGVDVVVGALLLLHAYDRARMGDRSFLRFRAGILLPPLAFGVCGLLSLVNADHPEFVGYELVRLAKLVLVMLVVMNIRNGRELETFVLGLSLAVVAQGVLGAAQYATGRSFGLELFGAQEGVVEQDIGYTVSRAGGTLGHPNILGYFFELLAPLMFALFFVETRRLRRLWYLGAFCAAVVGVLTTLSRGAWMTFPLSVGFVFLVFTGRRLFTLRTLLLFLGLAAVACVILGVMFETIERRLTHDDYQSARSRIPLNEATWSIIEQRPWLGVGLNNFAEVFERYDTTGKSRIFKGYEHVVHNQYLWVWAEVGTLGLLAFLWIFAAAFREVRRTAPRAPPWRRGVLLGAAAGLGAHLVHGLVDPGFRVVPNISALVYALLGLIGCVAILEASRRAEERRTGAGGGARAVC